MWTAHLQGEPPALAELFMAHHPLPPNEILEKFFEYDLASETLFRKRREVSHSRTAGYPAIYWKGQTFYAHRLVRALHHGPIPKGMVIDHIDRNPLNYKLSNLRLVTSSENNLNKDNPLKHGLANIRHDQKYNRWEVKISRGGKRIYLGYFANLKDARIARDYAHAEREAFNRVIQSKAA